MDQRISRRHGDTEGDTRPDEVSLRPAPEHDAVTHSVNTWNYSTIFHAPGRSGGNAYSNAVSYMAITFWGGTFA